MLKKSYLLLLLIVSLTLAACTGGQEPADNEGRETATSTKDNADSQAETDSNPSSSEEAKADASDSDKSKESTPGDMAEGLTSLELVKEMGNGINLGNTMEAYGHEALGIDAPVSDYETFWGQPVTTQEMISGMKEAGFDSLRIPVAWTNTMDYENGDYTIRADYLDRVEEIVNYALNEDMYVMINDHWDGGWWGMFGSETPETREKAMDLYVSMWNQIGNRFKDYSYHVIFESANEELGNRLNDADVAADSGSLSTDECYDMTNTINQVFVDTIRNQGGNNASRFLLIAGYNTDIAMTVDDRFSMPSDQINDRLLLSVHYYTPWSYCGTESVANWGTEKHYINQNELLSKMTKFTDMGYGIVFGEYAVLTKSDGSLKNNTIEFSTNFLDNCDLYSYVPMLWDTSSFFIRRDLKIHDQPFADLYLSRSRDAQSSLSQEEIQANAKASMEEALAIAIENDKNTPEQIVVGDEETIAWIMFNSNDYNVTYSVGDVYDASLSSDGVVATTADITGQGTYTVGLDFTGTGQGFANSTSFSALGLSNGELIYPGYIIELSQVLINGQAYTLKGIPYTTSDDEKCTRVNLYNGWVTELPEEVRVKNPNMKNYASPTPLDPSELKEIKTIEITFNYIDPNN